MVKEIPCAEAVKTISCSQFIRETNQFETILSLGLENGDVIVFLLTTI